MPHAEASIGTTNYVVAIRAGHHDLTADEGIPLGGKDVGPAPYELLCSALCAIAERTPVTLTLKKSFPIITTVE